MNCEALPDLANSDNFAPEVEGNPDLLARYQECPATSAPCGNFPETPEVPANVKANHIFEPLSCPPTPAEDTKPKMWA